MKFFTLGNATFVSLGFSLEWLINLHSNLSALLLKRNYQRYPKKGVRKYTRQKKTKPDIQNKMTYASLSRHPLVYWDVCF